MHNICHIFCFVKTYEIKYWLEKSIFKQNAIISKCVTLNFKEDISTETTRSDENSNERSFQWSEGLKHFFQRNR